MKTLFKKIRAKVPIGLYHLVKARFLRVKFPHAIQFNITFKCNQHCTYCGIYKENRPEMTTDQVCNMIDEFVEIGTSRLSITGGEPLLREDFTEVVKYARKKGLFVSLATNGSLIEKHIDGLKYVNSVNMTLDGPESIHDAQRGKGNFKTVLNAIKLLKGLKIPVYIVSVITKNNCDRFQEILELARSLDIRALMQPIFFSEQSHANNLKGYLNSKYDEQSMVETLDKLMHLKKNGDDTIILSNRYYSDVKKSILSGKKIRCCNAGSLFCTVSPDGRVAPCNLLVKDMRWLNGNEIGFSKAFMNMPDINCDGCLSSFIDIDYLYSLKVDVAWNYYKHYLTLLVRKSK